MHLYTASHMIGATILPGGRLVVKQTDRWIYFLACSLD